MLALLINGKVRTSMKNLNENTNIKAIASNALTTSIRFWIADYRTKIINTFQDAERTTCSLALSSLVKSIFIIQKFVLLWTITF